MPYAGLWYSDLGATLRLEPLPADLFRGHYQPYSDGDAVHSYPIAGSASRTNAPSEVDGTHDGDHTLNWSIRWSEQPGAALATTTWSGRYQSRNGQEMITSDWHQSPGTGTPDSASTGTGTRTDTGTETFTRQSPSPQAIASARQLRPSSHPT